MALKIADSSSSRLNPSIVLLSKIPFYPTVEEFGELPPIFTVGLTSSIRQARVPGTENVRSFILPECSKSGDCLFGLSQILSTVAMATRQDDRTSSRCQRRKTLFSSSLTLRQHKLERLSMVHISG